MKYALVLLLAMATNARADRVYLTEHDAPTEMFGRGARAERKDVTLTQAQTEAVSKALGRQLASSTYTYLDVRDEHGAALGVIFELDVVGQSRPITFAVGVGIDGGVRDVAVMVYREPHGDEITDSRFRKQFAGKRVSDPIVLGKDVDAITGATISSRSATFAARKGLYLAAALHAAQP